MTSCYVLLFKTGYGSEGFPIGVFTTIELAQHAISENEKTRSASYSSSGVFYEIYICSLDDYSRAIIYSETYRMTNEGRVQVSIQDYTSGDIIYSLHKV